MKRLISLVISIVLILSCGVNVYGAKYEVGDKIPNFEYITVDSEIKAPSPDVVYKSITVSAPIVDGKELYKCEGRIWLYEGIAFNSAYDTEVPQYRLRNPNATRGAYHFTSSAEERDNLIAAGWISEGICFYSSWK